MTNGPSAVSPSPRRSLRHRLQGVIGRLGDLARTFREIRDVLREHETRGRAIRGSFAGWRWVGPGHLDRNPNELRLVAGPDAGLFYCVTRRFDDLRLRLSYRPDSPDLEMSAALRFMNPFRPIAGHDASSATHSFDPVHVAAQTGFEVPLGVHPRGGEPGVIQGISPEDAPGAEPSAQRGEVRLRHWNLLEVHVEGDDYTVRLNGKVTTRFTNTDPSRGKPASADPRAGFVGVILRRGRVALRPIVLEAPVSAPIIL